MTSSPTLAVPVYRAEDFHVVDGANIDGAISIANEAVLDDVYELKSTDVQSKMSLIAIEPGFYRVAEDTRIGKIGALLVVDSCLTVMTPSGTTINLLILVELDKDNMIAQIYVVPLAPISTYTQYRLVGIEHEDAARRLAEVSCVAFSKGTSITMASGRQVAIEDLQVGDMVLTRDAGPQPIRWIGTQTLRAIGDFAPVVITKDTLNNANDLIISPDNRLFIYQRRDALGAGRSEVLVKARHLINNDTVYWQEGGFAEYYQLLFDDHQIIYAEGIAVETLFIDTRTTLALKNEISEDVLSAIRKHSNWLHSEFEVRAELLGPDAVEKLKKASKR